VDAAALLDLLIPRRCVVCGVAGALLCPRCKAVLPVLPEPLCARCGAPTIHPVCRCRECRGRRLAFATARAGVAYLGGCRVLVAAWKERGLRTLAADAADLVAARLPPPPVAVLTWVPADPHRSLRRGHHPAERLARELGARWGLPAEPLLRRPRAGPRQRGLPLAERRRNVAHAFAPGGGAPTRVALVDDVYTTGSTAAAAASALRAAGAREVHVVTFARAVREG
jgi:predicted amidophosphoribosyltransferase